MKKALNETLSFYDFEQVHDDKSLVEVKKKVIDKMFKINGMNW